MNKHVFSVIIAGCLLILATVAPTRAQMPGTAERVSIPFDFIVGAKTLPAGEYEIRRFSDLPDGLVISNLRHHADAMFETEPVAARKIVSKGEIVFHRYGDSYFLFEVWAPGLETGREALPSRQERSLRREMARNNGEPETVALAAY